MPGDGPLSLEEYRPCAWCDAPTAEPCRTPLCPECRAVHDGPVFHCPRHPVPTLGTSCAECDREAAQVQRTRERNAPLVFQLQSVRRQLVAEWHQPWPGCEYGKAIVGHAIDSALADLEGREPPPPLTRPVQRRRQAKAKSIPERTLNRRDVEKRAERLALGVDHG